MNRRGFLWAVGAAGVLLGWHGPVAANPAGVDAAGLIGLAITQRRVLEFTYHGYPRRVEPHALGRVTDDRPALLAWQVAGGSRSEPPPGWRTFVVAEIESLRLVTEKFTPRPDYRPARAKLKDISAEVAAGAE